MTIAAQHALYSNDNSECPHLRHLPVQNCQEQETLQPNGSQMAIEFDIRVCIPFVVGNNMHIQGKRKGLIS